MSGPAFTARVEESALSRWSALRETWRDAIARAYELETRHGASYGPRVGGQFAQCAAMEKAGLLKFAGWGVDVDGATEGEVLCYDLTDEAKRLYLAHEAAIAERLTEEPKP